jgi:hypothetical protein
MRERQGMRGKGRDRGRGTRHKGEGARGKGRGKRHKGNISKKSKGSKLFLNPFCINLKLIATSMLTYADYHLITLNCFTIPFHSTHCLSTCASSLVPCPSSHVPHPSAFPSTLIPSYYLFTASSPLKYSSKIRACLISMNMPLWSLFRLSALLDMRS